MQDNLAVDTRDERADFDHLIPASLMSPSNDIHGGTMETAYLRNKVQVLTTTMLPFSEPGYNLRICPPQVAITVAIFVSAPYLPSISKSWIFLSKSNRL